MFSRFHLRPNLTLRSTLVILSALFTAGSLRAYDAPPEPGTLIRRLAFGSCNSHAP